MMRMASKWILAAAAAAAVLAGASASQAQQTIRVGWTIPAEESKYWMMRRPQEFPDLGKTYNIEWTQFQGTAPMTQALAAGALDCATQAPLSLANGVVGGNLKAYIVAQHVFEKPGGFSVYWAVMDNSPIKTIADLKGKTVGISVIGGGTQGPFNMLLKQNGVDPAKDIKLVEVGFAVSEDALRQGRVDAVNMNQPFAARAEAKGGTRKLFSLSQAMPNIVHILEACRADFVDKNPELVKAYVRDITSGMKKALANREETLKVVSEVLKAPIPVLETYLSRTTISAAIPVLRRISRRSRRCSTSMPRPGCCRSWTSRSSSIRPSSRRCNSGRDRPKWHALRLRPGPSGDIVRMKKWRSRVTTDGLDRAPHRAFMRAMGLDDAALAKPMIGVVSMKGEQTPCNMTHDFQVEAAKEGIAEAGGTPREFTTISVSDGISMNHEGMKFSLFSRELIADSIEAVVHGLAYDALIGFGGCDKTLPGVMMGMIRCNVPSIFIYGGSALPGRFQGKTLTVLDSYEAVGGFMTGEIDAGDARPASSAPACRPSAPAPASSPPTPWRWCRRRWG